MSNMSKIPSKKTLIVLHNSFFVHCIFKIMHCRNQQLIWLSTFVMFRIVLIKFSFVKRQATQIWIITLSFHLLLLSLSTRYHSSNSVTEMKSMCVSKGFVVILVKMLRLEMIFVLKACNRQETTSNINKRWGDKGWMCFNSITTKM